MYKCEVQKRVPAEAQIYEWLVYILFNRGDYTHSERRWRLRRSGQEIR